MTAKAFLAIAAGLILTGCAGTSAPDRKDAPESGLPVPVLDVGEAFTADLQGDGRATITVTAIETSNQALPGDPPVSQETVHLVVTVKILLDEAGNPITGGPDNFRYRAQDKTIYKARTNAEVFPPELTPMNLTTTGQRASGRLFFDVPAELAGGGHIQLMTGRLVHVVWKT